jgi:hypothetical protein
MGNPALQRLRGRERQERLDRIAAEVESGELRIRKATAAERQRWRREREWRRQAKS